MLTSFFLHRNAPKLELCWIQFQLQGMNFLALSLHNLDMLQVEFLQHPQTPLQLLFQYIITIKCWKLKWRGVWGGSWSLFYLLISFLLYRGRKFIPWSWNWLQQSSSFMGRAIPTTASTSIVFIFIINSVLIKSYSISLFNIECYL